MARTANFLLLAPCLSCLFFLSTVLLDSNKITSKHLLSRRRSSPCPSSAASLLAASANDDHCQTFEFDRLLRTIRFLSATRQDASVCDVKSR